MHAEAEPNEYVRPVVATVVIVLLVWNLLGWMAGLGWSNPVAYLLAALTGAFELLAFNASVQMRRAGHKGRGVARTIWFAALAMCSGWSIYSAHHALGVFAPMPELETVTLESAIGLLQTAPAVVVLTVAACLVPLLPWAIEETEKAPPVSDPVDNYADRMRPTPVVDIKVNATKARPGRVARAIAGTVIAATAATALPAAATEAPRPARTDTQPKAVAPPATAAEQRAVAMLEASVSLRQVERETGLTYARVRGLREWVSRAA